MIAHHDFPRPARLAVVKQDEVFNNVEKTFFGEHGVKQDFRIQLALVFFSVALPLDEVFPLASDRTVARAVTVADHEKRVVMEGLCDAVFMQVISQIVVEASPNVQINGLELYENQWQTVHEADKIGPPIVVRHAHAP